MRPFRLEDLKLITDAPHGHEKEWLLEAEHSIDYLRANAGKDEILIYANAKSVLIHGFLALTRKITPAAVMELQHRNIPMPDDSWVIQRAYGGGKGHRMYLQPPLTHIHDCVDGGEKLVFRRRFVGVAKGATPVELSQKLIHALDLHFVPERNAYSRLDLKGDIEDVIKVVQLNQDSTWDSITAVSIQRNELDRFMALSKTSLVLRFDFTRVRWGSFGGWGEIARYERNAPDLAYHGGVDGHASYCNGVMVVRPQITIAAMVREWKNEADPAKRQYATFKIFDRKNNVTVETSCAPQYLSNYFQKSELPWEISPAFFRPEVLHRFKADPEKYKLEDRSISCRNAWYLKSYDINEAGQVHAYIGDLAGLPYEEQIYWQSFNEWPKGPISRRAHQTDIVGDWYLEYEPLGSLKHAVGHLDSRPPSWWKVRGPELKEAVRIPATDSVKEWADELLALDQYLIEGFLLEPLRELARVGKRIVDERWGSLRVLQEVLVAGGQTEHAAKSMVAPLQRLHALRTKVRGHATGNKKQEAESKARAEFGNLRRHFQYIAAECDQALLTIMKALDIQLQS